MWVGFANVPTFFNLCAVIRRGKETHECGSSHPIEWLAQDFAPIFLLRKVITRLCWFSSMHSMYATRDSIGGWHQSTSKISRNPRLRFLPGTVVVFSANLVLNLHLQGSWYSRTLFRVLAAVVGLQLNGSFPRPLCSHQQVRLVQQVAETTCQVMSWRPHPTCHCRFYARSSPTSHSLSFAPYKQDVSFILLIPWGGPLTLSAGSSVI